MIIKKLITQLLTHGYKKMPLFWVEFDYANYKENGAIGECMTSIHPILEGDDEIRQKLQELINLIRMKYVGKNK